MSPDLMRGLEAMFHELPAQDRESVTISKAMFYTGGFHIKFGMTTLLKITALQNGKDACGMVRGLLLMNYHDSTCSKHEPLLQLLPLIS